MQTIKQLITAAAGYQASVGGRTLLVQACDQGSTLNITLVDTLGNRNTVYNVGAGAKLTPATGFSSVDIQTAVDANVVFVITNGDIDVQLSQIGSTIANTNANPVPVAIVSEPGAPFPVTIPGTVNVSGVALTATNVGINNTAANPVPVQSLPAGSAVADVAAQAVTGVGAQILAASATRKRVIFRNAGAGQLAITAASGTTFANAAIVLQPGDAWRETDAPQLAWYAVSDVGTNVTIQTVN